MLNGETGAELGAEKPPESPNAPESGREIEWREKAPQEGVEVRVPEPVPSPAIEVARSSVPTPAPEPKDEARMKVERALEENLWELYFALPKESRVRFRAEGERTAAQMRAMIDKKNVRPHAVHAVIDHWLKTIPKVNPWFLLQEGKIKTDTVMTLVRERRAADGE